MKLREYRNKSGKTQREIAEVLRVSIKTYQNYEYEVSEPDSAILCALADYYRISLDDLLGRTANCTTPVVSNDECDLLLLYRQMELSTKAAFMLVAQGLAAIGKD